VADWQVSACDVLNGIEIKWMALGGKIFVALSCLDLFFPRPSSRGGWLLLLLL